MFSKTDIAKKQYPVMASVFEPIKTSVKDLNIIPFSIVARLFAKPIFSGLAALAKKLTMMELLLFFIKNNRNAIIQWVSYLTKLHNSLKLSNIIEICKGSIVAHNM